MTVADLSALFQGQLTDEVLDEAIRLGYLKVDGDRVRVSGRLLDAASVLVREGIPLPAILAAGREVQAGLDTIASLILERVITHVLGRSAGAPAPHQLARLAEAIQRLRPIARTALDAEFGRAMDRRARVTYGEFIRLLAAPDRRSAGPQAGAGQAPGGPGPSGGEAAAEKSPVSRRGNPFRGGPGPGYHVIVPVIAGMIGDPVPRGRRRGSSQESGRSGRGGHRGGARHRSARRDAPGRP